MALASGPISALDSTTKGVIWNKIVQNLIAANLNGIGERWYILKQPWISQVKLYPCGVVSEYRGSYNDREGVIGQAETRFRFIIAAARAGNYGHQSDVDIMLEWDQAIRRLFRKQHPPWLDSDAAAGMSGGVTITEGESFIPAPFREGVDALFFMVEAWIREARGPDLI